jgi:hypothetical protein
MRTGNEKQMKLTNAEIEILQDLVQDKLEEIYNGPEGIEIYYNTKLMEDLLRKLDVYDE